MARHVLGRKLWIAVPAVLLFFFLAVDSLVDDSPTMDEQNHMARGLAFLRTGDPRLSLEHPPLINVISALPLLTVGNVKLPLDHPSWQEREGWYAFAEQLLWVANHDVDRLVFLARLPIVFLTLSLAVIAYRFARQLWGPLPALLAFGLVLFDPNILAHGRYSTTDLGVTTFLLLAVYLHRRLWQDGRWSWRRLFAAALGLGAAIGSKLSALILFPTLAVLAIVPLYAVPHNWRASGRRIVQLGLAGLLSLPVLWALYGFEYGPFRFLTEPYLSLNSTSGPMPTFWAGIEQILKLSSGGRPTFLLGQTSTEGFWYYFPIAFLTKTPLPTLALAAVSAYLLLKNRVSRKRAVLLIVPPAAFMLLSMQSALNIGYRHLLPMLPFLYVLISGMAAEPSADKWLLNRAMRIRVALSLGALASILLSTLIIHPHYLTYFNAAAGGPSNGQNILIDSNIDWGQDLLRLKSWMADHAVSQVKLAWFGTADPNYYGIDYDPLPGLPRHFDLWWNVPFDSAHPQPGVYAISASNLWELPLVEKTVFPWFRAREADDRIGYSIFIYVVRNDGQA